MTIGERIKQKRNELKLSQRELCKRMGYSDHSTIAKIEQGKVDIPQSRIVEFAEALGVTVPYIMGWEDKVEKSTENDGLSENMKRLIDFVKTVPDDKVELVLKVMKSIVEDD